MKDIHVNSQIKKDEIRNLLAGNELEEAFTIATQPLHEALHEYQSFDMLEQLNVSERVALAFDYIQSQVAQGGFIQLIQNGYTTLLLTVIEGLQEMKLGDAMAMVLDDVLKVYVLNVEILSKEMSVEAFAKLYSEFTEFELLEERFNALRKEIMRIIIDRLLITENQ